jgi:hypothetical protein
MESNQDGRVTDRELPSIDELITTALTALDNADRAFTVGTHGEAYIRVPDAGGNMKEVTGAVALGYAHHLNAQALGYAVTALALAEAAYMPEDDEEGESGAAAP